MNHILRERSISSRLIHFTPRSFIDLRQIGSRNVLVMFDILLCRHVKRDVKRDVARDTESQRGSSSRGSRSRRNAGWPRHTGVTLTSHLMAKRPSCLHWPRTTTTGRRCWACRAPRILPGVSLGVVFPAQGIARPRSAPRTPSPVTLAARRVTQAASRHPLEDPPDSSRRDQGGGRKGLVRWQNMYVR